MIVLIDTTKDAKGKNIALEVITGSAGKTCEYINPADLNISPCRGCNFCWLKTPGECAINGDVKYRSITNHGHKIEC